MVIIGPAESDIQMLPPTVAEFHTLNDARNASQLVRNKSPASQPSGGHKLVQMPDRARRADLETPSIGHQAGPAKLCEIDQSAHGGLWLRKQPRPPGQPRIAGAPVGTRSIGGSADDVHDGVEIHPGLPGIRCQALLGRPTVSFPRSEKRFGHFMFAGWLFAQPLLGDQFGTTRFGRW